MRGKSPEENEDVSLRPTNYLTYKNPGGGKNSQKKKEEKKERKKEEKGKLASSTIRQYIFLCKKAESSMWKWKFIFPFPKKIIIKWQTVLS